MWIDKILKRVEVPENQAKRKFYSFFFGLVICLTMLSVA